MTGSVCWRLPVTERASGSRVEVDVGRAADFHIAGNNVACQLNWAAVPHFGIAVGRDRVEITGQCTTGSGTSSSDLSFQCVTQGVDLVVHDTGIGKSSCCILISCVLGYDHGFGDDAVVAKKI
ncbi:MAG: hypothetical protein BWY75_02166 [bacterium ADurb.Bin425]|nr:MAG: hypothetical protein BWY75_02166 [bacterium ADurb.Bin425]